MKLRWPLFVGLIFLLVACGTEPDQSGGMLGEPGLRAWIDRPLEGSEYPVGKLIPIRWHASGPQGIRSIEIRINGETFNLTDDIDPTSPLVSREVIWKPSVAGAYLIEVIPTGLNGAQGIASENRVLILGEGGKVQGIFYMDIDGDGQAASTGEGTLEGVEVNLFGCVDTLKIETALDGGFRFENLPLGGDCVIDFNKPNWHLVSSIPGGLRLPMYFSPESETKNYTFILAPDSTPTAITSSTLTPEPTFSATSTFTVEAMTASPPTATTTATDTRPPKPPTPDEFGPPKPLVIGPKDNEIVDCPGDVILIWKQPYDPSGIANYKVELFISHDLGGSWQKVEEWNAINATQLDVTDFTDCGNMYAWKVSARDGASNLGAYELVQFRTGLP